MRFIEGFGSYILASLEELRKLIEVNFIVKNLIRRGKSFTAHERQTAEERQVTTLTISVTALARTGTCAFGTTASGFTLPCRNTTSHAFSILF
jgi:hypothetical protein